MQKKKREKKVDYQLTTYTQINSKCIEDLNVSCETRKIPEESIGSKVSDIPPCNYLLI